MELMINHGSTVVMAAILCLRLLALSAVAFPINSPETHVKDSGAEEQVPKLLLDIYKCWNSGSKNCLPYKYEDSEVNLVRTLFGQCE